jgi:hypothetical protein
VEIDMMRKQMSKRKLERLTMQGGDYRKAGRREGQQHVTLQELRALLEDDVKSLHRREQGAAGGKKGTEETGATDEGDWIHRDISDHELDMIMDRSKLFPELSLPSARGIHTAVASAVSLQSEEGATSVDSSGSASTGKSKGSGRKRKAVDDAEEEVVLDYGEYHQAVAAASPHKTPRMLATATPASAAAQHTPSSSSRGKKGRQSSTPQAEADGAVVDLTGSGDSSESDPTADVDAALAAAWEAERAAAETAQLQGSVPLEGAMYDIIPECRAAQMLLSLT